MCPPATCACICMWACTPTYVTFCPSLAQGTKYIWAWEPQCSGRGSPGQPGCSSNCTNCTNLEVRVIEIHASPFSECWSKDCGLYVFCSSWCLYPSFSSWPFLSSHLPLGAASFYFQRPQGMWPQTIQWPRRQQQHFLPWLHFEDLLLLFSSCFVCLFCFKTDVSGWLQTCPAAEDEPEVLLSLAPPPCAGIREVNHLAWLFSSVQTARTAVLIKRDRPWAI